MAIYFIYWFVFSVISWIELQIAEIKTKVQFHSCLKFLSYILIVFLVGFRWRTGTDWEAYIDFFKWTSSRGFFEPDGYMDYGYVIFNNFCYFLLNDYSSLLVIHAILFYLLLYKSYSLFLPNVIMSVFFYTVMFFGMMGSNRQLLAVALGFYSLVCYLRGNYKTAILLLLIAITFHLTAFLMLLYIFFEKEYKLKYILIAFAFAIILGQSGVIQYLFEMVGASGDTSEGKVEAYTNATGDGTELSVIGIVRRVVMMCLLLYYSSELRKKYKYFDICLNAYMYTVAGFLIFKTIPILAGRGMLYFNILEPVLLIYLVSLLKNIKFSMIGFCIMFLIMVLFFFQAINLYPHLFIPYQGIFINADYYRPMG